MENLFVGLNEKVNMLIGNVPFALCLLICLLWGLLSVLFCPCHLASIPMLIGYIKDQKTDSVKYAVTLSLLFSFAIFLVICIIGLVTVGMGKALEERESCLDYVIGVIFILVGLHICGVLKYHHHDHCHEEHHDSHCGAHEIKCKKKGYLGAFLYGLVFGVILAPCTFAYMAPIMGVALKKALTSQFQAFLMFLFYGIGNVLVISCASIFTEYVSKYNHWTHDSKACSIIKIICGVIIIIAGIYMFFE